MNPRNPAQTFLNEAEDLLMRIEEGALELSPNQAAGDLINHLFRAFHTLKGSGAMFGFDAVAEFTHHVETVLDQVREGNLPISAELISLILRSKDQIKALLDVSQTGGKAPIEAGAAIVAALSALLPASGAAEKNGASAPGQAKDPRYQVAAGISPEQTCKIHFRPSPDLLASGTNPIALLNELRELGDCRILARTEQVPPLEGLQPDRCYLAWDISLVTDKGLNAIKDVFMFVEDGSELRIEPAEIFAPDIASQIPSVAPVFASGNVVSETKAPRSSGSDVPGRKPPSKDASVRVPSERLDRLVNLVGELVMNQSRLSQVAALANVPNLAGPVEELERLVDELRDNVLGIRMMPIGATFSRFKRLVHDLSAELHKEIDLVTEGAETELDKTVLDQLGDPLVHLIRNSIDHGIEPPEARASAGKPPRGTICLAAAHVGSNVVITISDDGHGIDAAAVRAKAVERGLIAADATLTEAGLRDLIMQPGFSTAKEITNVSGRGVGMDVVKRQIEALRGQVALSSHPGLGTTLTLTLPLTLAIIDGLLVEIGRDQFIVPMSVVTENVELHQAERARNNGRNVIAVRGELVPYICLREHAGFDGACGVSTANGAAPGSNTATIPEIQKVVIARHGDDRVGLVVDRVLGSHQTVIQPLGRFYRDINLVSGATIMGDGRVALILDLGGLVRVAQAQQNRTDATVSVERLDHSLPGINKHTYAPCSQGAPNANRP